MAREIVERGLNVRQVEALAKERAERSRQDTKRKPTRKDADTLALERRVSDALGLRVTVDHRGKGGMLHVRYRTLDQLEDVVRRLEKYTSERVQLSCCAQPRATRSEEQMARAIPPGRHRPR